MILLPPALLSNAAFRLPAAVLVAAVICLGSSAARAEGPTGEALTPAQMIEQLKQAPAPAAGSGPRTRSLRNLAVESVSAGEQARASLSLQIQFDFNSARVRPESQKALSNLAQALQSSELATTKFAIEGHTDAKGRADYNQQLSQQRADAVKAFLVHEGVQTVRLSTSGKGSTELANPADPLAAENRRVRVVNLSAN